MAKRFLLVSLFLGTAVSGLMVFLYIYGFASMVDPTLAAREARWRVWDKMLTFPDPGLGTVAGIVLLLASVAAICAALLPGQELDD